jgi:hypothetical protein
MVLISIQSLKHVSFLNSWILATVHVHNFALKLEALGRFEDVEADMIEQGHIENGVDIEVNQPEELACGKAQREWIKCAPLDSIE